jgi:hypothetical protein
MVLTISVASSSNAFQYLIDGSTFYPIPEIARPEKGVVMQDRNFHCDVVRITDSPTDVPSKYNYAQPGYPKHNIENANGTKLLIQSKDWPGWHIWNAMPPYNKIKDLPAELVKDKDPDVRWDNDDGSILYCTGGTKFYKYNWVTDEITVLYDFKVDFPNEPVVRVYMMEEGDASDCRRYWAFIARCKDETAQVVWYNTAYVVFDKDFYARDKGKIISRLDSSSPNWVTAGFISMSPSGKYVWIGDGHHVYSREFSTVRDLRCSGHADMAFSDEGREVIVVGGWYGNSTWIKMVDLETGESNWLAPIVGAYHISGNCHDRPGWAVISVYYPSYPEKADDWSEHSVLMIELTKRKDPPARVWRIANTHTVRKDYSDDPFAKINKRGTKIWFGSGWGNSYQDGQYDVYQVNLPATWYQDLMGANVDVLSPRAPGGLNAVVTP